MCRHIRRFGPYFLLFAVLVGLSLLLVPTPRDAVGATFTDPYWDNVSSQPECVDCGCGCPKPSVWSAENVNFLTGESMFHFPLLHTKGMVQDFSVSIMWRGYLDGMTQVGNGAVLSFEHTVEKYASGHPRFR